MWSTYLSLKTYHKCPSEELVLTGADDSIAAWCVDKTVLWFGMAVENLLAETVEVGFGKEMRREKKYTLEQLLDPTYKVTRPLPEPKVARPMGLAAMMALAAQSGGGIKVWQYVKPS